VKVNKCRVFETKHGSLRLMRIAFVGAIGVAARAAAARIERNPDPFPHDLLARQQHSEEVLISRSDWTVLRAVVAGKDRRWS
jgi:hypothetical protein